jgi:hypothetical protein
VQHRDHRHLAEFDALEGAMPAARMGYALRGAAFGKLGEIEARTEMVTLAGDDDCPDRLRQCGEERLYSEHGRIVDGIALLRTRERENGDIVAALGLERGRQSHVEAVSGSGRAHSNPRSS